MNTQASSDSFPLGQTIISANARVLLHPEDVDHAISRHARADWGELPEHDAQQNEVAIREGFRLLSAYRDRNGCRFLIITEADRSCTAVVLPEEF